MLLDVDGNAFFAKGQSAFFIYAKLADEIRIMEVAFVALDYAWIACLGNRPFCGTERFEHVICLRLG